MTYNEALALIPSDAKWSASFGYPGEGGYTEFHRTPSGERWIIGNGTWMDFAPFQWSAQKLEPMPLPPRQIRR